MMSTRQERERLRREDEAAMRTPTSRVAYGRNGQNDDERFVAPSTLDRVKGGFGDDPATPSQSSLSRPRVAGSSDEPASVASKPAAVRPDEFGARFTPKPGSSGGSWSVESAVFTLNDVTDARRHPAATEALAEMFAASPAVGVDIVMRGGIGALAHAVDVSPAEGTLYAPGGLALIHALASADATSRRVKADESVKSGRALVAVLDAMDRFARDERTQQWGAMALWAMCRDDSRAKARLIRSTLGSGKSPAAVLLAALELHGEQSEPIAKACIGAMLCVATNEPEFQSALAAVGAPRRILETLETHRNMSFAGEFDALREWLRECAR